MGHPEMLFALSARSPAALLAGAGRLADWLAGDGTEVPLADVAHTLAVRRTHLAERLTVRAADRGTLIRLLRAVAAGGRPGALVARGTVRDARPVSPVFVFSGHGSQWDGMGAQLLSEEPEFAATVAALEGVVKEESGYDLRTLVTEDGLTGSGMDRVQPAVYALQLGIAAVLRGRGIRPAAVIGHSMGEITAAVVAGALTPEDGARIVCRRSLLMERTAGTGATALVELPAAEARRRLTGRPGISVAVHSSPRACVVAGRPDAVERFVAECRGEELLARLVPGVRIGAHSPLVDPLLGELGTALTDIASAPTRLPCYGTTLEDPRERAALDAAYWAANLRRPVRLTEAVRAAADDGLRVFLEVSPHPVVAQSVLETVLEADATHGGRSTVLGTLSRGVAGSDALADTLAALHCAGVTLPRAAATPGRHAELPGYAWQHRTFDRPARTPVDAAPHPLLGHHIVVPGTPVRHLWQSRVSLDRLPWLGDHRVQGAPVLPGTAYAELALAAACDAFGAGPGAVRVDGLELVRLLPLTDPVTLTTTLEEDAEGCGGTVTVVAGVRTGAEPTVLAHARLSVAPADPAPADSVPTAVHSGGEDGVEVAAHQLYAVLHALGQEHGPAFAGVGEVRVAGGVATSRVSRPPVLTPDSRWRFHPALLDACLHGVGALLPTAVDGTFLPTGIERIRFFGQPGDTLVCRARLLTAASGALHADIEIMDAEGAPVAEVTGLRIGRVGAEALPVDVEPLFRHVRWEPGPAPEPRQGAGLRWLVVDADPDSAAAASLSAAGVVCELLPPSAPPGSAGLADGVLLVAGAAPDVPADASADVPRRAERQVDIALRLAAGLLLRAEETGAPPPPLTVLTVRAQQVRPDEEPDPEQAALRGVVRTLCQERPELRARSVDLAGPGPIPVDEILDRDGPDEVAWRDGLRLVARLTAGPPTATVGGTGNAAHGRGRPVVRPGGGYLVSGGTRGLGLATARWLAEGGAGALVLGGRGVVGPDAAEELERIRSLGAHVELVRGDVARPGTAERMIDALAATGVRLRGVVHTAAVLEDAAVTADDGGRLHRVWAPKADGAWRLHEATVNAGLDWWLGFSSLAALVGSPGQAEYAAANAFLDSVVAVRRARGLPALTVNWGPWGGVGAVRDRDIAGLGKLTVREGFAALERLLAAGAGRAGVARLTDRAFARAHPQARGSSFLAALAGPAEAGSAFDVAALAGMPDGERRGVVRARTLLSVGRVLGFSDHDRIDDRPLVHLGLDSITAVRVKSALYEDFGVEVPVARLLQGVSAAELAEQVADGLADGLGGGGGRAGVPSVVRDAERRGAARTATAGAARARRRNTSRRNP
ncbi:SDR family oxidoreductase [Streptomyces sp. ID03-2B]|uniref:SDR family oxidoreductase n=2 Tax=Streptomyces TaxID=1883 RepID=A0ABW2MKV4_9ACTN|nr:MULTISPECIES: SDR family oxidoreductase [unclassified Streptomyces]MDX3504734.1 SDR family oxidoreductase [Streptomyces sp. ATCC51928]MDX3593712.1 SDR family oxidoreductase [Streptomyces sp. ID03-2B]MDX5524408.1 SDR family oxidoreductase [Streptomyces sp. DE06-01C]